MVAEFQERPKERVISPMSRTIRRFKGKTYQDRNSRNRKAARSCLNHGGCSFCEGNRLYQLNREIERIKFYEKNS